MCIGKFYTTRAARVLSVLGMVKAAKKELEVNVYDTLDGYQCAAL